MCDLSDPRIVETYTAIIEDEPTNWLILGYNDTRDVISLYSQGTGGLSEFREHLSNEVLYGFVRIEDRFILITWVSEQVSGVRRARALVHSRSVAALLKLHQAQVTASTLNDLSDANIRTRLKLGENQQPSNSRRSSTNLSQKRASRRQSTGIQSPTSPTPDDQHDEFVEASETLPTPPVPVHQQPLVDEPSPIIDAAVQQEEEQKQQALLLQKQKEEEENNRRKAEEQQRQAKEEEARRIAAEKEAKRLEEERILKEKQEAEKKEEEKRALQRKLLEAEKNKGVILSGFVSVQPSTSPFWRRRYFVLKGRSMAFYNDELQPNPVFVLDLSNVKRLSNVNVDNETFVPNAFVLETQLNGTYQLFADDKKGLQTILTALQTVI